jgi:glutathione synthase/RimK-type ligase-like ATP-grasp enzyme
VGRSQVLIVSTPQDVHAAAVAGHLGALGASPRFFAFDRLIADTTLRVVIDGARHASTLTLADDERIELGEIDAVWLRRPGLIRTSGLPEPWMETMVNNEGYHVISGLLRSMTCLFVNHPASDHEAAFKLWQLEVARRVGLAIPKTIVTNVPETVAAFYEECRGEVIGKLVSESTNWLLPKYETVGVPTLALSEADLPHLDQVAASPHLFQEKIDKRYDIRVTAIGRRLFPVRIESQVGTGAIDWRMDYSVPMEPTTLPDNVHEACLRLLQALSLNYGAIDLAVDRQGRYVFFEINCAGQYKWMEDRIAGLELSLELARLLVGQCEPMIPATRAPR